MGYAFSFDAQIFVTDRQMEEIEKLVKRGRYGSVDQAVKTALTQAVTGAVSEFLERHRRGEA